MDAVVFPWQDDVPVLEEGDPAWQPEVRVRPLVDLVGEGAEDAQAEDEALPGVQLRQGLCGEGRHRGGVRPPAVTLQLRAWGTWMLCQPQRASGQRGHLSTGARREEAQGQGDVVVAQQGGTTPPSLPS